MNTLDALQNIEAEGPVLDLAFGSGRNGIYLVEQGLPVVFADRQQAKLDEIALRLQGSQLGRFWAVDLEAAGANPLEGQSFAAILVFRYLHRPLLPAIKDAVQPGGIVIYETFTVDQPRFGRPHNPDYLLRAGELEATFDNWECLHQFEGVAVSETSEREQAIARIVARKPLAQSARH